MKPAMFRCTKVTFEEKKTHSYDSEPRIETSVTIQFELVGEPPAFVGEPVRFGYAHMALTEKQFKEVGYQVGQVYSLNPT